MRMTAETWASWTVGPMKCEPGTVTEGCCWWGRGAIQTTGPHNVKLLQDEVVGKVESLSDVDLCTNPEAICQVDQLKWMGALYYWTSIVQKVAPFQQSLEAYVATGFSDEGSVVQGASFNAGTGGTVNNGAWSSTPHGNEGRMKYFHDIIDALKAAGMGEGLDVEDPTPAPTEAPATCEGQCKPQGETCYVESWGAPCFTPEGGEAACAEYSGEFCG